jgi:UMF1 family MFS transporter
MSQDYSLVTAQELRGFYSFGWAAEGYSALALGVYFPIILEEFATNLAVDHITNLPCVKSSSGYKCDIKILDYSINTTSVVFFGSGISVLIQLFLFISLGSIADHGNKRKLFMILFGAMSALLGSLTIFITDEFQFWPAMIIFIFSNVCYSASHVFLYSFIPILIRFHPEVVSAKDSDEFLIVRERVRGTGSILVIRQQLYNWYYVVLLQL